MIGAGSLRKGWCPGALRPMQAKDGLLVRLKPSCGVLYAAQAQELAECSRLYGNGLLDLTSRGNLQIRGVRTDMLAALQTRLGNLGVLDPNPETEAVRNILISPLHGQSPGSNVASIAKELESELRVNQTLHALPAKFSFLIDDGSLPSLHNVAADVRFLFSEQKGVFSVWIGGTEATAFYLGECKAGELVATATGMARRFLNLMAQYEVSHMRELITCLAPSEVAQTFGFSHADISPRGQKIDIVPIGMLQLAGHDVLGLGLPFGRLTSSMLEDVAYLSEDLGGGEMRLTPFRTILIPGVTANVSTSWFDQLAKKGFIVEPHDARLNIAACGGQSACEQATTSTQADGLNLAKMLGSLHSQIHTHVSGCKKGCAHPAPTPLTLVANAGLYDVILNGAPDENPIEKGLNLTEVKWFIKKLTEVEAWHDK